MYKRCLRVVYNDGHSSYDELLNLGNTVSRHPKNLQNQAMIMFRVYTGINLRNQQEFTVRPMKTVHHGLNSLAYLGPKIWGLLPNNLQRLKSVEAFKSKIKS